MRERVSVVRAGRGKDESRTQSRGRGKGITAWTAYLFDLVDDLHGLVLLVAVVRAGGLC